MQFIGMRKAVTTLRGANLILAWAVGALVEWKETHVCGGGVFAEQ